MTGNGDVAEKYDVILLGGGPAGYACAIRAAQLGLRTAVIERDKLGGVCVNAGCIPTKAVLHSAYVANLIRQDAKSLGVRASEVCLDFATAAKRSRRVSDSSRKGVEFLLEKNDVEVIAGQGVLLPGMRVHVGDYILAGEKAVVIATGSRVKGIPEIGLDIDGSSVISSDEALQLTRVPESLAIVGAGPVGMEFAEVFNAFGSSVTVIEVLPRLLPLEDPECSEAVVASCKKRKIATLVAARIQSVTRAAGSVTLQVEARGEVSELTVERVLVAAGRSVNVENLALSDAGVELTQSGFIKVNTNLETTAQGIYAVGDVAGPPMLAHKGSREGVHVAEVIAGRKPPPIVYDNIPSVTYCHPEVASIGLTEEQCKERQLGYTVGRFPLAGNGRARASLETHGFVKIIRDSKSGRILGAHIVASHASEMIHELAVARQSGSGVEAIENIVHAHPTLSEAVAEAALNSLGRAIHL